MQIKLNLIIASVWLLSGPILVIQTITSPTRPSGNEDKLSRRAQVITSNYQEDDRLKGQHLKVDHHPDVRRTRIPVKLAYQEANETKQLATTSDNLTTSGVWQEGESEGEDKDKDDDDDDDELGGVQFIQVGPSVLSNLRLQQQREQHHQQQQQRQQRNNQDSRLKSAMMSEKLSIVANNKQVVNSDNLTKLLLDQQLDSQATFNDDILPQESFEIQSSGATYVRPTQSPKIKIFLPKAMKQFSSTPSPPINLIQLTTLNPQIDPMARLYLDTSMPLLVRVHLGETASMLCRLRANLQQFEQLQVSWVRNMQILTSGEFRYTSDERFRPTRSSGGSSNDWLLEIHNARATDEGDYECQVNSEPKPASVTVHLQVITTQIEILEAPIVSVNENSEIELTCRVQFNSQAQLEAQVGPGTGAETNIANISQDNDEQFDNFEQFDKKLDESSHQVQLANLPIKHNKFNPFINNRAKLRQTRSPLVALKANTPIMTNKHQPFWPYWYKDNISLEYNNPRGNVKVQQRDLTSGGGFESLLKLGGARRSDNGTYICKLVPSLNEVQPAQAQVFVVPGAGAPSLRLNLNKQQLICQLLLLISSLVIQINSIACANGHYLQDWARLKLKIKD